MIVKDEEEFLEQCINSVKEIVDEIIIIDTGSKDKTIEIAKKFNAKILKHESKNFDFSEARNISLGLATKDWILILDADETISKKDAEKIKEIIKSGHDGYYLTQRNYTNDSKAANWVSSKNDSYEESKKASGWYPVEIIRLFKNNNKIKFKGKVHEVVDESVKKPGRVNLPIHHFGRLRNRSKSELYSELGKEKIKDDANFETYFQLGIQLQEDGKIEQAKEMFEKSIELNENYFESWLNYGACLLKADKIDESINASVKSLNLKKTDNGYNNLGIALVKAGKTKEAATAFNKAININPNNAGSYFNMGLIFDKTDKKDIAYKFFKKAIDLNPEYKKKINIE